MDIYDATKTRKKKGEKAPYIPIAKARGFTAHAVTIAILLVFNSISWGAPAQQDNLRPTSTGQRYYGKVPSQQWQEPETPAKAASAGVNIGEFAEVELLKDLRSTKIDGAVADALKVWQNVIIEIGLEKFLENKPVIRSKDVRKGVLISAVSFIGPFAYAEDVQVALTAIEQSDGSHTLLAVSSGDKPRFYKVAVKSKAALKAIIAQLIDSGSLSAAALPAWWNYHTMLAQYVPGIRIRTGHSVPPLEPRSDFYTAMMKKTQPKMLKELKRLVGIIDKLGSPGAGGIRRKLQKENVILEKLDIDSLTNRGLREEIKPKKAVFSIKAKATNQEFIISCRSWIPSPSQIKESTGEDAPADYNNRIAVKRRHSRPFSKSSSAGLAECAGLQDLRLAALQSRELGAELGLLKQELERRRAGFLPQMKSQMTGQEDIMALIREKSVWRIPLVIGPFVYGEKELFLMLARGRLIYKIIAIDIQDLRYFKVTITDKRGFDKIIWDFMKGLEKRQEGDPAARAQLGLFIEHRPLWNIVIEKETAGPNSIHSAGSISEGAIRSLLKIAQSA